MANSIRVRVYLKKREYQKALNLLYREAKKYKSLIKLKSDPPRFYAEVKLSQGENLEMETGALVTRLLEPAIPQRLGAIRYIFELASGQLRFGNCSREQDCCSQIIEKIGADKAEWWGFSCVHCRQHEYSGIPEKEGSAKVSSAWEASMASYIYTL